MFIMYMTSTHSSFSSRLDLWTWLRDLLYEPFRRIATAANLKVDSQTLPSNH
jgi:hypothetical protein